MVRTATLGTVFALAVVASTAQAQGSQYELLIHWPGSNAPDYRQKFSSRLACQRAKAAVMSEHESRVQELELEAKRKGSGLILTPLPPVAMCIPLG